MPQGGRARGVPWNPDRWPLHVSLSHGPRCETGETERLATIAMTETRGVYLCHHLGSGKVETSFLSELDRACLIFLSTDSIQTKDITRLIPCRTELTFDDWRYYHRGSLGLLPPHQTCHKCDRMFGILL